MFGWEFPPHIAGGLGTACYGMTRGLARNDVEVIFVMPRASGDEDERFVKVVNASDVEATYCDSTVAGADDIMKKISFIHIDSNMVPYISPEEFASCGSARAIAGPNDIRSRESTARTCWRRLRVTPWWPLRWPRISRDSST